MLIESADLATSWIASAGGAAAGAELEQAVTVSARPVTRTAAVNRRRTEPPGWDRNGPNTDAAEGQMSFRRERRPLSQIHVPIDEVGSRPGVTWAPGMWLAGAVGPPVLATQVGCAAMKVSTWSALSACIRRLLSSLRTSYDLPLTFFEL